MRIPDPKANTTTEAYLAYKAGFLEAGELKPSLYEPNLHFDAWLAYWAGLTNKYPGKKNLLYGTSNTEYGVTGTLSKDGVVSVVGTATSTGGARVLANNGSSLKAGTYTLSISEPQTSVVNLIVSTDEGDIPFRIPAGSTSATNTIPDGSIGVAMGLFYAVVNGTTYNSSFKLQLIAGDAPDYDSDPYIANPEMLCDEEALVAYLSGVTDTYPEEIKDPYDVRIVGYLKYLVSARFGRPEYPVNNQEFYLSTMKPPVVPSGDTPATNIELDGTIESPFIDLKMFGDTYQNTLSGKNLYLPIGNTSKGLTLSYNSTSGECSITGTANDTWSDFTNAQSVDLPSGTYTLSTSNPNTVDDGFNLVMRLGLDDNTNVDINLERNGTSSKTLAVNKPIKTLRLWAGTTSGKQVNWTGKVMLETGDTATSFEPYCGGVASPNPDYPQLVQTVTGRQVVKVKMKNLAVLTDGSSTGASLTVTRDSIEQSATISGTPTTDVWPAIVADINVSAGKTYIMSISEPLPFSLAFRTNKINSRFMNIPAGSTVSNAWTPSEDDYGWVFASIPKGVSTNVTNLRVQIELGSVATEYQKGRAGSYEINLGKNLAKPYVTEGSITKNGVTMTMNDDGTFTLNGTSTGDSWIMFCGDFTSSAHVVEVPVAKFEKGKPYILSYKVLEGSRTGGDAYIWAQTYSSNQTGWEKSVGLNTEGGSMSLSGDGLYRLWVRTYNNTVYDNMRVGVQVEAGSVKTEFTPYFEPIELCEIGDYQDRIYRGRDGEWYLHKEVRHLSLAVANMNNSENYPGWNNVPELREDLGRINTPLENVTTYDSNIATRKTGVAVNSSNSNVLFLRTEVFGLMQTQWKTSYPSLVLEVYYGIITPITDTQITNQALIDQLNALFEGGSYDGKTYVEITATDPNLPAGLIVEAAKYV